MGRGLAYAYLALVAAGGAAADAAFGLGLWNYAADRTLPAGARWAVALAALAGLAPRVADAVVGASGRLGAALPLARPRAAVATLAAVGLFVAFETRNLLGDGPWLLYLLARGDWLLDPNAPGAKFFQIAWNALLGGEMRSTWALSAFLMGAIYVWSVLRLRWPGDAADGGLFALACLSMGVVQFFFGYIEDYALPLALMPVYVRSLDRAAHGDAPATRAGAVLGVLVLWTLLSGVYALPVLYLAARAWRAGRRAEALRTVALVGLPWLGFQAAFAARGWPVLRTFLGMNLFSVPGGNVRPLGDLLTAARLADFASVVLQSAAAAPALLVAGLAAPAGRSVLARPDGRALLLLALPAAAFTWAGNSYRGPYYDWDVLAVSAFPLTLLGARLALAAGDRRLAASAVWVGAVRAAVWIGTNAAGGPPADLRPPNLWD